jgi:pimeloyl-ACP methyl ester carboxylesterase
VSRSLLLIPSQLCTAAVWQHQIAALRDQAQIAIADHRSQDSMADLARSILAAAPARFALAAHGMGGFIAFEMWRQASDRIERLALFDTLATPDTPAQRVRREGYADLVRRGQFAQVIEERLPILFHPDLQGDAQLLSVARSMASETGPEAFLRQQQAIITRPDSRPTLATITCPVTVVIGRQDRITAVADAQVIAAGISGARLEILDNCGHLTPLEQPEHTTRLLEQWLSA